MKWLLDQNGISKLNADKNLGPVVMESTKYPLSLQTILIKTFFSLEANQKSLRKTDFHCV